MNGYDGISRRDLLKMGLFSSALMMSGAYNELFAMTNSASGVKIPHATHFGAVMAVVSGSRVMGVEPHKNDYAPTSMLYSLPEYVHSQNRIKYPCVRKSFLAGKRDTSLRGCEEFVRVDWKTALDLVAKILRDVKENYGNESIYRPSFAGWSHPGVIGRPDILQGRFMGLFGGFTDTIGDYSAGAATHILPHVMGGLEIYSYQTTYEMIAKHTKTMVLWGSDPFKTFRISYSVPDHTRIEWFVNMKNAGMKFISIDPVYTETAKFMDAEWIPIKPNTDVAMIMAICFELFTTNEYDSSFINKYTVGFDIFKNYITGKHDGVRKSPEWAEKICGVSAGTIRRLAFEFRKTGTLLTSHYGCQRADNGEQFHWSLITLACMLGQIGTPGGGYHFGNGGLSYSGKVMPRRMSQGRNPARTVIPASRIGEMLLNPGRTIDFNGNKITYPKISMLHNMGSNIITQHPNTNELLEGMRGVENIITHEIVWNATAKYSDIVLPVTSTFERNDITYGDPYSHTHIWAMKQVIPPLYEAKDDYWVLTELAKRLGFEKEFTEGRSQMDWIRWSYANVETNMPFEQFWRQGFIEFKVPSKNKRFVRLEDYRKNPNTSPLFTPSGRIEIFSEKVASFGYDDCPGHPTWIEPKEWLGADLAQTHKYHLLSIHPKHRMHSQMDNISLKEQYKIKGREPVVINPEDAWELGIKDGDLVEVYNERGSIICGAQISSTMRRNVVRVDEGAWYSPEDACGVGARCLGGNVNVLTPSRPTSKLAQACAAHSCLVSLKKIQGKIKNNEAYKNPVVITEE
ncbi:molybdopterin guanine dinucleotide-containing S/N-oxide reductase [Geovibrio sp. ADMFC3]